MSFVAAGIGVSLVPESVRHMTVRGAVYARWQATRPPSSSLVAWRRDDVTALLEVVRSALRRG